MSSITPPISIAPDAQPLEDAPRSLWSDAWKKLTHNPTSLICLAIVVLYLSRPPLSCRFSIVNHPGCPDGYSPPTGIIFPTGSAPTSRASPSSGVCPTAPASP
jgi:hypothetical protein